MTRKVDVQVLRERLSDTLNETCFGGQRIVVQRRGRAVAALIPLCDLDALEGQRPAARTKKG